MNLPQAQDFEAQSFLLYLTCTTEREEGKLMESCSFGMPNIFERCGYFA
jgi:hypothetical protein